MPTEILCLPPRRYYTHPYLQRDVNKAYRRISKCYHIDKAMMHPGYGVNFTYEDMRREHELVWLAHKASPTASSQMIKWVNARAFGDNWYRRSYAHDMKREIEDHKERRSTPPSGTVLATEQVAIGEARRCWCGLRRTAWEHSTAAFIPAH